MAISVVYTIREIESNLVKDIIVHSDEHWFESGSRLVVGGIRKSIEKKYPTDKYKIIVDVLTH